MNPAPARLHAEQGLAAVELALFTAVILIPLLILLFSLPTWWERQSLGRLTAQETARTLVLADSWDQGVARGHALAAQLAVNHGVDPADVQVVFAGSLERGGAVRATATVAVPALMVPLLTSVPSFTLTFSHTEAVDLYRSLAVAQATP